jgi:hypothetical protein
VDVLVDHGFGSASAFAGLAKQVQALDLGGSEFCGAFTMGPLRQTLTSHGQCTRRIGSLQAMHGCRKRCFGDGHIRNR